ncbi:hypothetical protein P350_27755 [Burkholderia cepacia JBK9]|nr:hypothetical protein P350_27755 [Burkholderia cepacia JBK9]
MSMFAVRALVIVAFMLYTGIAILGALRSGVANAGGRRVARRSHPYAFGFVVLIQTGFFVLFCWAGFSLI